MRTAASWESFVKSLAEDAGSCSLGSSHTSTYNTVRQACRERFNNQSLQAA